MLNPVTLSVAQLGERWRLAPRQVIEQALQLRVPLYFAFEGLLFDATDQWLPSGKDWQLAEKANGLRSHMDALKAQLSRNAKGRAGEYDRLGPDEIVEGRQQINAMAGELEQIETALEERERERRKRFYRGLVRIAPAHLYDILRLGETLHPHLGFHPNGTVRAAMHEGAPIWDGPMVKLEPATDRFDKQQLTESDLFALVDEVEAIEATARAKHPPASADVPDEPRVAWRVDLRDRLSQIDSMHGGKANVQQVLRALKASGDRRIDAGGSADELIWFDDYGTARSVPKKTLSNAISDIRDKRRRSGIN
jgi:hypothetical protein